MKPTRGQMLRELVMITSVALVVVTVSFGIYSGKSDDQQLTALEQQVTALLPH